MVGRRGEEADWGQVVAALERCWVGAARHARLQGHSGNTEGGIMCRLPLLVNQQVGYKDRRRPAIELRCMHMPHTTSVNIQTLLLGVF